MLSLVAGGQLYTDTSLSLRYYRVIKTGYVNTLFLHLGGKILRQLEIYAGLEIDYLDETYNASIPYFQELPLDYRIGSITKSTMTMVVTELHDCS